jgi:hypothetical protein
MNQEVSQGKIIRIDEVLVKRELNDIVRGTLSAFRRLAEMEGFEPSNRF